jgi:hypothetical protein
VVIAAMRVAASHVVASDRRHIPKPYRCSRSRPELTTTYLSSSVAPHAGDPAVRLRIVTSQAPYEVDVDRTLGYF